MQFQPISTGPGRHALDGFEYFACDVQAGQGAHIINVRVSHGLLLAYGTLPRPLHIGKAHEQDGVRTSTVGRTVDPDRRPSTQEIMRARVLAPPCTIATRVWRGADVLLQT
jgi:hypothetical protein